MKKRKKLIKNIFIISIILIPLLMFLYQTNIYASLNSTIDTKLGSITLKTNSAHLKKGDIIPIELSVGGNDIFSFVADLEYDRDLFDEIDVTKDIDVIDNWKVFYNGFNDEGFPIIFLIATNKQYAASNEKIATIYLRALEDIEEDTDITLKDIYITNTNNDDNSEDDEFPDITLTLLGNTETIKYNITYNSNTSEEVTNMPENNIKTEGEDYTISGKEPSRAGHTFEGWNTKADGTGTTYTAGATYKTDEDLELYAQWKEVPKVENLYLSSETYKIGNNDINNYEEGDKYISRVIAETKLKDYINNLKTNGNIKVIKENGTELTEEEYVGTGMTLVVTKEEEKIELKIAVMGDLDGNGTITATDLSTLNQTILKEITLENEYKIAADLDENENLTATDLSTLNKMLLKIL